VVGTRNRFAAPAAPARVLSPAPRDAWANVLDASAEATIFHTPEWLDACCAVTGAEDASRLYEAENGRQMVVPMVRSAGGKRLATTRSMPHGWGHGGAIAPGRLTAKDVSAVLADLHNATGRLALRPGPWRADVWAAAPAQARVPHCIHAVDLRPGFENLWSGQLSGGTRNKVRKAEKRGVEVEWGSGSDLMSVHWAIYLRWAAHRAQKRGTPERLAMAAARREESLERFQTMARFLGDGCRVLVAWIDGQAVASIVVFNHGAYAHYWRTASDQAADRSGYANYLLVARLLEDASERGHDFLDMGESGGVQTLMSFKEQFGARPRTYDELLFGPRLLTTATRARDDLTERLSDLAITSFARFKTLRDGARRRPGH
jgi:hypothetical protein